MEIPYTVVARRDTGLWNAKVGIWLFLASEVMLFGGLFSAYVFLRLDASPGDWPHGLLNVPVGTMNTAILIASSVTVVLAWASLKMREFAKYKIYMGITILCGVIFLAVKLAYDWPQTCSFRGTVLTLRATSPLPVYMGCTCSAVSSSSFIFGYRLALTSTSKILSTWPTASRWSVFSGTLSI